MSACKRECAWVRIRVFLFVFLPLLSVCVTRPMWLCVRREEEGERKKEASTEKQVERES